MVILETGSWGDRSRKSAQFEGLTCLIKRFAQRDTLTLYTLRNQDFEQYNKVAHASGLTCNFAVLYRD